MGSSRFDATDWASYSSSVSSAPRSTIFRSVGMDDSLDPSKITFRESVDSDINPNSTPVIIGVDETGSMGSLAEKIIKHGLGVVMTGIYDRKPVTDPHILIAGIGDSVCDIAPLQITQFEADVKAITSQVEKIYLEGGGGGNNGESYPLLWYFAAHKTKCDAITKRKRKGYLFTVGDENPLRVISKSEIKKVFGDDVQEDIDIADLLSVVQKNWEVFHIVVETLATEHQNAINNWKKVLGQRVIVVPSEDHLAEVIVSTMQIIEGEDANKVASSWDGKTSIVVKNAIKGLSKKSSENEDLVRL